MLTYGVVVLCDNACPHTSTAARTRALVEHFNWELFDHSYYNLDLAPSNCHLCSYLKNWLRSQRFSNTEELMEGDENNEELTECVKMWQRSQAAEFFDTGIQKLIP
jgi:hypothetical protein